MNRYYCLKCRRKLEHNSFSEWSPELTEEEIKKHLYANFSAWVCSHCSIAYIFLNSSGNENTVLTIIHIDEYSIDLSKLEKIDDGPGFVAPYKELIEK